MFNICFVEQDAILQILTALSVCVCNNPSQNKDIEFPPSLSNHVSLNQAARPQLLSEHMLQQIKHFSLTALSYSRAYEMQKLASGSAV